MAFSASAAWSCAGLCCTQLLQTKPRTGCWAVSSMQVIPSSLTGCPQKKHALVGMLSWLIGWVMMIRILLSFPAWFGHAGRWREYRPGRAEIDALFYQTTRVFLPK